MVHETSVIYDSIKDNFYSEISKDDYSALKLLDNNFILFRYPTEDRFYSEDMIDMAFEVLVNINSLVEDALNIRSRGKSVIRDVEDELSVSKNIE